MPSCTAGGAVYGPERGHSYFRGLAVYFCYIDESGDTGTLQSATHPNLMPFFVVCGLFLHQSQLHSITTNFLRIKSRFFPGVTPSHFLDTILHEIKGADIKNDLCSGIRRNVSHATGFLDKIIELVENHDAKLLGRVFVKGIGNTYSDRIVYSKSLQTICKNFERFLAAQIPCAKGLIIADSRRKAQNVINSHSIFTQIFQANGNCYPNLLEMPTYGHAKNHAPLQIADYLCSSIIVPMVSATYCAGIISNNHVHPYYQTIKARYASRIKSLQFRYIDSRNYYQGGLVVADDLTHRQGKYLFI